MQCICEMCGSKFEVEATKRPRRTCSKQCKNLLASKITTEQFATPEARAVQRQKSLAQKKDPAYQEKVAVAMAKRTARWAKEGHPRLGMTQPDSAKLAIGNANAGRFKGKTWDEIFGKEVADRRRIENSLAMSSKNEELLKNKRSKLEDRLMPYLLTYKNNVQISFYNVDFVDEELKHIIEVYGDYWHCNPAKYEDDFVHPYFKMTALAKRTLDIERVEYLTSLGYTVTIIWESDLDKFIEDYKKKHE